MAARTKTPGQIADIIERFLTGSQLYPQEFNDFYDSSVLDAELEPYKERCEVLHAQFGPDNSSQLILLGLEDRQQQERREAAAAKELEQIVAELRLLERPPNLRQ